MKVFQDQRKRLTLDARTITGVQKHRDQGQKLTVFAGNFAHNIYYDSFEYREAAYFEIVNYLTNRP